MDRRNFIKGAGALLLAPVVVKAASDTKFQPLPGPQADFFNRPAAVPIYGGATLGDKTRLWKDNFFIEATRKDFPIYRFH